MTRFDFAGRGRLPLIRQAEAAECGLACLAMVASYHGRRIDLNSLRRRHPVSLSGVTLRNLIQVASHLGLSGRPVRFELEHLPQLRLPAIVHWEMNHFVVLAAVTRKGLTIHDPACGLLFVSHAEAAKRLTGVALELEPAPGFTPADERARLPFSIFWSYLSGSGQAVAQIVALSVVLEILVIAAPFYLQLTIDEVIARGDVDLLGVLALGFALLALIKTAATAIRASVLLLVQNALHYQIGARLFHHLIRLPLPYFEKRHVGDVLSRFTSIEPIRNALAEGVITAVVDGVMASATLAMMYVYSPLLATVGLIAVFLYGGLRLTLYGLLRRRSEAAIQCRARENSTFIETLRAVQSLKLFNRESERESQWLNRYAETVGANVRLGRTKVAFTAANQAVFGLEVVLTLYLAAHLALTNTLTVGMILAFVSYKQHFTEKAVQLIDKTLEFRLLELHLERLSDIAMNPLEPGHDRPLAYAREIQGRLELRNVFFRYAEGEPFVLEDVSLVVEAGQFVTITGPSGGGKTTLMKIMLGLLVPTSGEVLIDGLPLSTVGIRAYREQTGAVMQEDHLLSGSIADNICFFDPEFDEERMIACARLAGVHEEIMATPMTYNSLVGDMGSSLSGGQKQRVLLARALYRSPKMLFLDEGTAHLDVDTERHVNESLRELRLTRICVAHRPDVSASADRVVHMSELSARSGGPRRTTPTRLGQVTAAPAPASQPRIRRVAPRPTPR